MARVRKAAVLSELSRGRRLMCHYYGLGGKSGALMVKLIEAVLQKADRAMFEGNKGALIEAYQELKGFRDPL